MSQIVKLRRSSVSGQKPTNSNLQLGELALNTTDGKVYMSKSGSLGPSVEELISTNTVNTGSVNISGSINLTGSLTTTETLSGSMLHIVSGFQPQIQLKNTTTGREYHIGTGGQGLLTIHDGDNNPIAHFSTSSVHFQVDVEVTGSVSATEFTGSGLGLINVPFHISGSDISGNTYNKTFTKLQFDDSTGLNVNETDPGTAFISIGSHFKDIFVSGSPILSATGSDAFEIIPLGGVEVSTSITDTNSNGYVKELTISTTNLSSSINDRIDIVTGSIDSLNNFSSSVVLTSQTGSMTVLSASYAVTAAFALNAGGSGGVAIGAYQKIEQTVAASTWSFVHNIGQRYPIFQVFNTNGDVIIPTQIRTIDENQAEIIFSSAQSGTAIASLGGGNGATEQFGASTLWTVDHNLGTDYPDVTVWDSNKNIVFPDRIESVTSNQIKIYFSVPVAGHVSVSRGGHILSGSVTWGSLSGKPSGIVSGSSQLTPIFDTRYVLSGSITQTTWDNIANKPGGLISGSIQVNIADTIGYSTLSSSIATINTNQDNKISSLETASGSIRTDFNSFTSSYTTISGSLDTRLDALETYSSSQLVPSSSMSFRTLQTDVYCKNMSGAQINKGTVVRIVGSVGDNPLIGVASLLTEGQSANTLGIATQDIPNDDFGLVITEGVLTGVNTSGMTAGQLIFLGPNGTFTTSYPVPPNHGVRLGEVLRVQQNQGSIYVRIDNGAELGESHDVLDSTTNTSYGDLLVKSGSVWINSRSLNGNYAVTGSLTITQNLTVLGSSSITYVTASQLAISSSVISVNVFEPVERFGGLKVYDSGSSNATASLLWDSLHNHWIYENVSGSDYVSAMFIAGPRNTGSLGEEPTLTSGRIVKSVGGDHIDNSIIIESGTTITVEGSLSANSLTGSINFNNLTNIPTLVSGSEQLTGSYDTRYVLSGSITQTTWDNIASKPDGIISGSSQIVELGFLETSSFNTMSSSINTRVGTLETSDYNQDAKLSSLINKTGSYATTGSNSFIGNQNINGNLSVTGSVVISGSLDLSNANIDNSRYLHTQTIGSISWTIYHNLNYNYPNVTVYDSDNKVMLPADVTSIDANTTVVTFATYESGHALVSVGGISTGTADRFLFTATPATGSWVIDHNLGYKYVNIDVYDENDEQLIPQKVTAVSINRTQIDFITPTSGNAIITIGGARSTSLFTQNGSFYSTTNNIGITGSLVVTGEVDAANFNTTSDKKLKTDLVRIEGALDKIEKLNGYTFNWLEEYSEDKTRQIGMIADEVYEVQPELISNRTIMLGGKEEEIKLLDYSKVTALLIEAIKELNDKVTKIENKRKKK